MKATEPFDNVPVRHPNGRMLPLACEVGVFSGRRWDIGGHQCRNRAKWRIPDFDKWGDIVVCGRHRGPHEQRSTELHSIFGRVAGEPTSVRFWLAKRDNR